MKAHYISHIHVEKLWGGEKPIAFDLNDDVNIIIGPNASGKTTIINLLMLALTGNVVKLMDYHFEYIKITLKSFEAGKELPVKVTKTKEEIRFEIAGKNVLIPLIPDPLRMRAVGIARVHPEMLRRHFGAELMQLRQQLEGLVPAAWLPVSRRLPITEEDDDERRRLRRGTLESVDECLAELLEGLQRYRLSLDAGLSELRKEFQKHALENILYDKRHDRMMDWKAFKAPTQSEKEHLMKAFQDVGFVDTAMETRINDHFAAAQKALEQFNRQPGQLTSDILFIIPLIHRTKSMVEFAQGLETNRKKLFAPLSLYESTIRSFIDKKMITVSPNGSLDIKNDGESGKPIEWKHLSSGEKQLLILLTQALLWERDPVVYVADEPELSLHVTWQEKLLKSITALAGRCQVIVATHSPDIAGGFPNKIIDLARI